MTQPRQVVGRGVGPVLIGQAGEKWHVNKQDEIANTAVQGVWYTEELWLLMFLITVNSKQQFYSFRTL